VRRVEDAWQGGGQWGSPTESVTDEVVWRRRGDGVPTTSAAPMINGGWLGLLQHWGRKTRVRHTEIEAGVAGKLSSPQYGNGGGSGSKSCGGGGSGDQRMAWVSSEKDLEDGGASVKGVPCERKESEGWHRWPF
jgi:hypothetical protein